VSGVRHVQVPRSEVGVAPDRAEGPERCPGVEFPVQHLLSTLSDAEIGTVEAAEQGGTSGTPSGPAGSAAEEQPVLSSTGRIHGRRIARPACVRADAVAGRNAGSRVKWNLHLESESVGSLQICLSEGELLTVHASFSRKELTSTT